MIFHCLRCETCVFEFEFAFGRLASAKVCVERPRGSGRFCCRGRPSNYRRGIPDPVPVPDASWPPAPAGMPAPRLTECPPEWTGGSGGKCNLCTTNVTQLALWTCRPARSARDGHGRLSQPLRGSSSRARSTLEHLPRVLIPSWKRADPPGRTRRSPFGNGRVNGCC